MALSVIFAEFLDESGCLCLRLENDGFVAAALAQRTFDEIKQMQLDSHTIIMLSTSMCGLYDVDLPWIGDRKARAAIPYALEEQLAQKLSTLHFAFDRAHHQHNCYLVVVVDKVYCADVMSRLDDAGIHFNEITVDWFALQSGDVCLTPSVVLVRIDDFQGAISDSLAETYLSEMADSAKVLSFTDSRDSPPKLLFTTVDQSFYLWAAKRLQQNPRMNLCQGELSHGLPKEGISRRWTMACIVLAGLWLISVLGFNAVNLIRLNHQLNSIDRDTAVVYREFFPDAQQVISPRFRINQLLGAGGFTQGAMVLWQLLDRFDKAIEPNELTVSQLEFKNKVLAVTLTARDFTALEELSARLKQAQVKVAQTQASSHAHDVTATMELRL